MRFVSTATNAPLDLGNLHAKEVSLRWKQITKILDLQIELLEKTGLDCTLDHLLRLRAIVLNSVRLNPNPFRILYDC